MKQARFIAILGGITGLAMICYPLFIHRATAAVVYSQNFDSLEIGWLRGQDNWTYTLGPLYLVTTTQRVSPNNSIYGFESSSGGRWDFRTTTAITSENGYLDFAFRTDGGSTCGGEGQAARLSAGFITSTSTPVAGVDIPGGGFKMRFNGGSTTQTTFITNNDIWYRAQFEWRKSDNYWRLRFQQISVGTWSAWTDWIHSNTAWTSITGVYVSEYRCQGYFDNLIFGSDQVPPPPPPAEYSISLTYPLDEAIVPDFNAWGLDYVFFTNTTTNTIFDIVVNTYPTETSTSIWYQDRIKLYDFIPDSTTTRSFTINKQFKFGALKTWYAKAFLVQGFTGDIFASSSRTSFFIATSTAGIWTEPPASTSTSEGFVMTCDPTDNLFERSLCYLFQYLFVPKHSDLDVFTDIKNLVITKPPFGYLSATIAALGGLTATTTPEVDLPVVPGLGSEVKSVLVIILWALALLHIFDRLRYFDI